MQRALLVLLWLAATAAATAVSWVGVSAVTDAVSDAPAPAIPAARVSALAAPAASSTTTTEAPAATTSTTTTTAKHPTTASTTTTTVPAEEPATTTTIPSPRTSTATFSTRGGSVAVACEDETIRLVSATPADGYRVFVGTSGPDQVDVSFRNEQHDLSHVVAHCEDGRAVRDSNPPPPSGPGPSGPGGGGSEPPH